MCSPKPGIAFGAAYPLPSPQRLDPVIPAAACRPYTQPLLRGPSTADINFEGWGGDIQQMV